MKKNYDKVTKKKIELNFFKNNKILNKMQPGVSG